MKTEEIVGELCKTDPDLAEYELVENGAYESYCLDTLRKHGEHIYYKLMGRKRFLVWHGLQKAAEEIGVKVRTWFLFFFAIERFKS